MTSTANERGAIPVYPVLLAVAFWLASYVASATDLTDAVRAGAWLIGGAMVVQVLFWLLLGRWRGGLAALMVVAGLLRLFVIPVLVLAGFVAWTLLRIRAERTGAAIPQRIGPRLTRYANAMATLTIALQLATGVMGGALGLPRVTASVPGVGDPSALPDIYLLMLDGHPSLDTMHARLGVDPGPFRAALEGRGFDVLDDSRSNYTWTPLTLLSMFNARHVDSMIPPPHPATLDAQFRQLMNALREPPATWAPFRQAGYTIATIPSAYTEYGLPAADGYLDSGQLNSFELNLLSETLLANSMPDLFLDQVRGRTLASIERTRDWSLAHANEPRLLFTHLLIPHAPYVFDADGGAVPLAPCFPGCSALSLVRDDAELRESRARAQLEFTDAQVIEIVDSLLAAGDPSPVIILFSDHGSRLFPDDLGERLENFMAVRWSGPSPLLADDATPMEIMPALARQLLGATIPSDPVRYYMSPLDRPFPLTPVEQP